VNTSNTQSLGAVLVAAILGMIGALILILKYAGAYLRATQALAISITLLILGLAIAILTARSQKESLQWPKASFSVILVVIFFLCKLAHDFFSIAAISGAKLAILQPMYGGILFSFGFLVLSVFSRRRMILRFVALAVALSGYTAINVMAYHLGCYSDASTGLAAEVAGRMLAPFGGGLNNFGSIAVVGLCLNIVGLWYAWKNRSWPVFLLFCFGACSTVVATYKVQIRSGLISVIFVMAFLCTQHRLKIYLANIACFGMIMLPVLVISPYFEQVVWIAAPPTLHNYSRTEKDFSTLDGRTSVYRYGWQLLLNWKTAWTGFGIAQRDSRQGFEQFAASDYATSYHNGFLELLLVYGPIIGLLGTFALVMPVIPTLARREAVVLNTCAAALCVSGALYTATMLEAFVDNEVFWVILCVSSCTFDESLTAFNPPQRLLSIKPISRADLGYQRFRTLRKTEQPRVFRGTA
jgi:hypothetical protein